MRVVWAVTRPRTHGALVALWCDDRLLVVRTSYAPYWSLPGGYVRRHETGRQAAMREAYEEMGVRLTEEELRPVVDRHHRWEGKRERLQIFAVDRRRPPRLRIDGREIVEARFVDASEVRGLPMFPPVLELMARRRTERGAPPEPPESPASEG
jgi:ADP-ribose pyrophosphatase YjhB (NUDIX family)